MSAPLDFGSIAVRLPLVMPGRRIGVLGGSFNPPHAGHLALSQTAIKRLGLDEVWWLVSPGNPMKSHAELESQATRLRAARRLASADVRILVTGFEADLPSPYSAATVRFLQRRHGATRFVWLMGADCLAGFHRWRQWRAILATLPVAVIDRPGWRLAAMASPAARRCARAFVPEDCAALLSSRPPPAWTFLSMPLSPLSSTELRQGQRDPAA